MLGNLLSMRNMLIAVSALALVLGCGDNGTNGSNQAPNAPSNPTPANGAADLPLAGDMALSWQCSDPDDDPLSYDVYFGTQQDPPLVSSDQSETSYQPDQLQSNSTYYWKIVAKDDHDHQAEGDVWSFSTVQSSGDLNLIGQYAVPNEAFKVFVSGSYAYVLAVEYDPDNDPIYIDRIFIVNIANPADPVYASSWQPPDGGIGNLFVAFPYMYLASGILGLHIFDIADPVTPILLNTFDTPGAAHDVYISGNYAYVADGDSGLQIIDVTQPTNPTRVGSLSNWAIPVSHIFVSSDYAFVILGDEGNNGIAIVDVADPANPVHVGFYDSPKGFDLYVSGNYLYIAAGYDWGLIIANITDRASPQFEGNYDTPGSPRGVCIDGNYAFVADDDQGLLVIDVSSPSSPTLTASHPGGPGSGTMGVFYANGYIYHASGLAGLRIWQFLP